MARGGSGLTLPKHTDTPNVVTMETGGVQPLTVPHIMPKAAWIQLREDLTSDVHAVVSMKLGYAEWRHLWAIVVDARCMLEFTRHVIVQLRIAQFDDGT